MFTLVEDIDNAFRATSVPSPTIKRSAVIWNCSGNFFSNVKSVGGDAHALIAECAANGCGRSVTPVPVSDTDCGLLAASSEMVTVAAHGPVAMGVKERLISHLSPTTNISTIVHVVPATMVKSH